MAIGSSLASTRHCMHRQRRAHMSSRMAAARTWISRGKSLVTRRCPHEQLTRPQRKLTLSPPPKLSKTHVNNCPEPETRNTTAPSLQHDHRRACSLCPSVVAPADPSRGHRGRGTFRPCGRIAAARQGRRAVSNRRVRGQTPRWRSVELRRVARQVPSGLAGEWLCRVSHRCRGARSSPPRAVPYVLATSPLAYADSSHV